MKKVLLSALVSCIFILFLLHQPATPGISPALNPTREEQTPGRQLPRKLKFPADVLANKEKHKMKESKIKVNSTSFGDNNDEEKSLINTADYQVVTTHISPSPKHPNP